MRKMLLFLLVTGSLAARAQGSAPSEISKLTIRYTEQGFPEQLTIDTTRLLAESIHFHIIRQLDGKDIRLTSQGLKTVKGPAGTSRWQATSAADELRMDVEGSQGSDGTLHFKVKFIALQDLDLKDIVMHIPFQKEVATYMKGLGRDSSYRPDSMYRWKWLPAGKKEASVWIGVPNAGLKYMLLNEASWSNHGNGGIDIGIKGKSMLANNYSGPRQMKAGDTIDYDFDLLITK